MLKPSNVQDIFSEEIMSDRRNTIDSTEAIISDAYKKSG